MFKEPISSVLSTSILARAREAGIINTRVISLLEEHDNNHHAIDDTPYGGGPGELMKISVIAPVIRQALTHHDHLPRENKRVILMDPSGKTFNQSHARRLSAYDELIFVSSRYEGVDARVHNYIDEALSLGDFILSSGDLAAAAIFDAIARHLPGVLGNIESLDEESFSYGRLEPSNYTRPREYEGYAVPEFLTAGNHAVIKKERAKEALLRTQMLRPDLLERFPLSDEEKEILGHHE